jgi:hypothetical protein
LLLPHFHSINKVTKSGRSTPESAPS